MKAYKKENGFLGLLGFDKENDELVFCSKSEIGGKYATYFKDIILSVVDEQKLYNYLKPHNVTLAFEVIDIFNDPHIIKYDKSKIVLLDIIFNDLQFGCVNNYNLLNRLEETHGIVSHDIRVVQ